MDVPTLSLQNLLAKPVPVTSGFGQMIRSAIAFDPAYKTPRALRIRYSQIYPVPAGPNVPHYGKATFYQLRGHIYFKKRVIISPGQKHRIVDISTLRVAEKVLQEPSADRRRFIEIYFVA